MYFSRLKGETVAVCGLLLRGILSLAPPLITGRFERKVVFSTMWSKNIGDEEKYIFMVIDSYIDGLDVGYLYL